MRYDYEDAFEHYRPHYLTTGRKNPCKYRITGEFNTGDYWCEDANNKDDLQYWMYEISRNQTIRMNTIAVQNQFGQLIWTRELGFNDGNHPKFMDSMRCFERAW